MRTLSIVFIVGLFLSGCHKYSRNKPANLIPEDTYINLLIEFQLLKSFQFSEHPDSATVDSLRQAIFRKYGTTQEQFKKSHTYYTHNVKKQSKRIQEAIERLKHDYETATDSLSQQDTTKAKPNKK